MKKNFSGTKKSYHELIEEQDSTKEVFKRSEQPRKKPIIIKEEAEKPKYNTRSSDAGRKPYQRKEFDKDERVYSSSSRNTSDFKKPYTPRDNNTSDPKKSYTPRSGSGTNKPSTPYIKK